MVKCVCDDGRLCRFMLHAEYKRAQGAHQEARSSSFCLDENRIKGQGLFSIKIYCAICICAFKSQYWNAVHCVLYGGLQFNIDRTGTLDFPDGNSTLQKTVVLNIPSPAVYTVGVFFLSSSYPCSSKV